MPATAADRISVPHAPYERKEKTQARLRARSRVIYDVSLDMGARLLYVQLDDMAGERGECWPKIPTLSAKLGASVRQVHRWLDDLRAGDQIKTTRGRRGLVYILSWRDVTPTADQEPPTRDVICRAGGYDLTPAADQGERILNEPVFKEPVAPAVPVPGCLRCKGTGWYLYDERGAFGDRRKGERACECVRTGEPQEKPKTFL